MQKNVHLLKFFNLAIFSFMRHKDYIILIKMSVGPGLPWAPAGMIHWTNDKVSAYGEHHTSSTCYNKLLSVRQKGLLSVDAWTLGSQNGCSIKQGQHV